MLHDDGTYMTLQQIGGIGSKYSLEKDETDNYTNIYGPTEAMSVLENNTSSWKNVRTLNFEYGTTKFSSGLIETSDNAYTSCNNYGNCTKNSFTSSYQNVKSRLVSVQELYEAGCQPNKNWPVWTYDFLSQSKKYGGTHNNSSCISYNIMNASNLYNNKNIALRHDSAFVNNNVDYAYDCIRPVVEVNK